MCDAPFAWRSRLSRGRRTLNPVPCLTALALALASITGTAAADGFGRTDLLQAVARSAKTGTIVAVGLRGVVGTSRDAGATWHRHDLEDRTGGLRPALLDVAACPDGRFAALDGRGHVFTSADDGGDWTMRPLDSKEVPQAIACDASGRLWVVGGFSTIMVSADAGESWEDRSIGEDLILTDIQFPTADTGYALGEFGSVYKTHDGGESWTAQSPIPGEFYPQAALFTSAEDGWVVGLDGAVMHTGDGGESWAKQGSGTQVGLFGLASLPGGGVVAVGDRATVLSTAKNAAKDVAWTLAQPSKAGAPFLTSAVATGPDTILAAGAAGTLAQIRLTP